MAHALLAHDGMNASTTAGDPRLEEPHLPHTESGARRFVTRTMIGSLLGATALSALGGGVYGLLGAPGIPRAWLSSTPFSSWMIPSLLLLCAVGGSAAVAAIAVFRQQRAAAPLALGAALVLLGFVVTEVIFIGYVSWLQPAMVILAKLVLVLLALEWRHLGPRARRTG